MAKASSMTVTEAAERLGVSRSTVHWYIEDGRIKVVGERPFAGRHPQKLLSARDVEKLAKAREEAAKA